MNKPQQGILAPVPTMASYLLFSLKPDADPRGALKSLCKIVDGDRVVAGLGQSLTLAMGVNITGLQSFPQYSSAGIDIPSTPHALWLWLRGEDRGELLHLSRKLQHTLASAFTLSHAIDAFRYGEGLDLTGYEDGTENPSGDAAIEAAIVNDSAPGLEGSSFVAAQQWAHDLDHFQSMPQAEQDNIIGRRLSDNEELDDAPDSAHVKRTAQESFEPEAFILRRSMPWSDGKNEGLMFIAFGKDFTAFEAQLKRMVGNDDGITDALFRFSRPVSGCYFWCPPMRNGHLDLSGLR